MMTALKTSRAGRCAIVGERGRLLERIAHRIESSGFDVDFLATPLACEGEDYRLLVLRSKSPDVTSWAKLQQQRGAVIVPDPRAIELIKDRWTCRQILMDAGMNVPEALLGTPKELRASGIERLLPVVLKQRRMHRVPVRLVIELEELEAELNARPQDVELVAERFVEGVHFTACFIGAQTFCFFKPPLRHEIAAPLGEAPAEVLRCVEQYRAASGLYFGKIDVVMNALSEVCVVDGGVSLNLWQVAQAEELLSDYFLSLLKKEASMAAKLSNSS